MSLKEEEKKTGITDKSVFLFGTLGLFISGAVATVAGFTAFLRLYYLPSNLIWAGIYFLLTAAVVFLYLKKQYTILNRAVRWIVGILLFVVLVFSSNGPALVACIWLAVLSAGLGSMLLDWLKLGKENALAERLLVGASLGIGALALLTYFLGAANVYAGFLGLPTRFFKLLHPIPVFAILAVLTALVTPSLYKTIKTWFKNHTAEIKAYSFEHQAAISLFSAVFALCFLALFIWALAPTIRFDSLVYHLASPLRYVNYHGILEVREPTHFYLSHYAEMLNALALVIIGQPLPGLLHLLSGLITLGLTVLTAQRLGFARIGWIAGALFFSMPMFYDAGTVHNDFYIAMFSLASFLAILAWWQDRKFSWLPIAGALAGLSIGVKINAVMPAIAGGIAILAGQIYCRTRWKQMAAELAGYALPVGLMYLPWAVLNTLWTHNPFFPFFCQTFSCASTTGFTGMPVSSGSFLPTFVNNFLLLPWNVTVFGDQYYIENFGGAAGAVFLLSLPWLYAFRQTGQQYRKTARLLAIFSVLNFLLLLPFSHRTRYNLPIIPILCILAAINLHLAWQYIRQAPGKKVWISAAILLISLYFFTTRLVFTSSGWQIEEHYPYEVALGLESREAFLSRAIPSYDALQFLNKQGNEGAKVASFGDETRIYTSADVHTFYFSTELAGVLTSPQTPVEDIARGLKQLEYQYILHQPAGIADSDYPIDTQMVSEAFLSKYARLIFARNDVFLYELFPEESPAVQTPGESLLANNGFEEVDTLGALSAWTAYNNPQISSSGPEAQSGKTAILASDQDYVYQRVPVDGGTLYTLGHWSRIDGAGEEVRLQVMWLDQKSQPISVTIEKVNTGADWSWNQLSYSAPEEAVFAQVYVTTGSDQKAWFDGICFVEGPDCSKVEAGSSKTH